MLKLWFSLFFLVCLTPRSSLVKVNKETKEFIRLFIENSNGQVICFSSGPVRAIPRGTRVKNAIGDSPSAFLVPDVLLWDLLLHFPELVLLCPSCDETNTQETLNPIRWKDGSKDYDQPRLLYGLRNDVLLVFLWVIFKHLIPLGGGKKVILPNICFIIFKGQVKSTKMMFRISKG